jgi:hypothetical protein
MEQKRAPRALKWRPRQQGGVGWPEATRPKVLVAARARISVGGPASRSRGGARGEIGENCEGLTVGPHAEVSERGNTAADTWDCEGAGVHLAVAHRERERAGGVGS